MKLDEKEFQLFKSLHKKLKAGKISDKEKDVLAELIAKKQQVRSGTNDFSWYNRYPDLAKDAGTLAWNQIAGVRLDDVASVAYTGRAQFPTAGLKFEILPNIGRSESDTDAFNLQVRRLWIKLHEKYRGLGGYDSADLGITILAVSGILYDIARAERIYGLLNSFDVMNRSKPHVVLQACGIDDTNITADDITNFRFRINYLVAKLGTLCLPKGITQIVRTVALLSNVFVDSTNNKAQWFIYDTPYRMTYAPVDLTSGGCIRYKKRTKSNGSFQTLQDVIDDLSNDMSLLISNTDIAKICSDLLAAFGNNGIITFAEVPEGFSTPFVYDENRLLQMHNSIVPHGYVIGDRLVPAIYTEMAAWTGFDAMVDTLTIYQYNNVIRQNLAPLSSSTITDVAFKDFGGSKRVHYSANYIDAIPSAQIMLDTWKEEVSHEDVIEMTQYSSIQMVSDGDQSDTKKFVIDWCYGSILIVGGYYFATDGSTDRIASMARSSTTWYLTYRTAVSHLDWRYIFYTLASTSATGRQTINSIEGDRDNFNWINFITLQKLHEVSTLSLFDIPDMDFAK